jgi:hypothetical protein
MTSIKEQTHKVPVSTTTLAVLTFITAKRAQQNRRKTKVNTSSLLCDLRVLKPENLFSLKKDT